LCERFSDRATLSAPYPRISVPLVSILNVGLSFNIRKSSNVTNDSGYNAAHCAVGNIVYHEDFPASAFSISNSTGLGRLIKSCIFHSTFCEAKE